MDYLVDKLVLVAAGRVRDRPGDRLAVLRPDGERPADSDEPRLRIGRFGG